MSRGEHLTEIESARPESDIAIERLCYYKKSEAKRSGQLVTNDFIPYITSTEIDCRTCVVVAVAISLRLSYLHIELILQSLARNISILNVMKSINVA